MARVEAGRRGGLVTWQTYGFEHYSAMGRKGGGRSRKGVQLTEADKAEMWRLWQAGVSQEEIAFRWGIYQPRVCRVLKERRRDA